MLILSAVIIFATSKEADARSTSTQAHKHTSRFCRLHHPLSSRSSLSFNHRFARPLPALLPLVVLLSSCSYSQPTTSCQNSVAQFHRHCRIAASQRTQPSI